MTWRRNVINLFISESYGFVIKLTSLNAYTDAFLRTGNFPTGLMCHNWSRNTSVAGLIAIISTCKNDTVIVLGMIQIWTAHTWYRCHTLVCIIAIKIANKPLILDVHKYSRVICFSNISPELIKIMFYVWHLHHSVFFSGLVHSWDAFGNIEVNLAFAH